MSKLKTGEVAVKVSDEAVQILGGYGYVKDYPGEKWHRDARIYPIFEGTSEIRRLAISRAVAAASGPETPPRTPRSGQALSVAMQERPPA